VPIRDDDAQETSLTTDQPPSPPHVLPSPGAHASVLVVCTANIARSPLVAALLRAHVADRALDDHIAIASAGVHAREGDPAAAESAEIATHWGLNLTDHRSQPVVDDQLARATLVVTLSERQRDHLARRGPGIGPRCFTLRELHRLVAEVEVADLPPAPVERLVDLTRRAHRQRPLARPASDVEDVADPYGRGWDRYVTMANDVAQLVDDLADPLFGP
jgi:protein-tyrosine phosphatase